MYYPIVNVSLLTLFTMPILIVLVTELVANGWSTVSKSTKPGRVVRSTDKGVFSSKPKTASVRFIR